MQRRASQSRWVDYVWEPWGVLSGYEGESGSRQLVDEGKIAQWLHPGFDLLLHKDEIEGYYRRLGAGSARIRALAHGRGTRCRST
jgi:hypothetical protein